MTSKILIDARLYGPTKTGIGRYTQNLLLALKNQPNFTNYDFSLLIKTEDLPLARRELGNSYKYIPTNISHYSLVEQLKLPALLKSLKPDLVHFTHFNKPLLYQGNCLITVHDLIKHFFKGKESTTHTSFLYWPKYIAYRLFTDINIRQNPLIVPSNFWRDYLISRYHLDPQRITTTYEAVDPKFLHLNLKPSTPKDYLLYTGNLYPHKNIEVVFRALKSLPNLKLKIICARSVFQKQAQYLTKILKIEPQVEFLGFVPDSDFPQIYANAIALIHPSLMEGFSLTGLEAMSLNCPVIAANSSCLPEIYGSSVLYFDPHSELDLVSKINEIISTPGLREKLIALGQKQVTKYSWNNTAAATLSVYEKLLR
jgi:glycosyltransferase involved in cell wall biosynthesis